MSNIIPQNYIRETLQLRSQIEGAFLDLGERLYKIREEKLYVGEFENFEEFLLTAKLSKATASKLITVYETFVLKYNLPTKELAGVGWSALYTVAGHADTKEKAEDLVQRAGLLTRQDLEVSLRNDSSISSGCSHLNKRTVEVCNDCGYRKQIF